jgi:tRNA dimethylallyltransferase
MRPIVIAGPTAVGKTKVAVSLASELGAQIISVDSRQVYRYMDIGTAKPDREDLNAIRHHLIDLIGPDEHYSAGTFGRDAASIVDRLAHKGIRALLVGGSGLYLSAYVDGFFDAGEGDFTAVRRNLRERLEREGLDVLYRELGQLDPHTQFAIDANDEQRILRALELVPAGGKQRLARHQESRPPACRPLMICLGMDRQQLYDRIDNRVDAMIEAGWVAEVRGLIERGFNEGAVGMNSLGYEEILSALRGTISLDQALERIKRRSRQYAKRQLTWFRRDRRMRWLDIAQLGREGVLDRIMRQTTAADA